jgi:hypothetical protein
MAEKVTVKKGDTLSSIAKANNTTVKAILANPANSALLTNPKYDGGNTIFSGTKVAVAPVSKTGINAAAKGPIDNAPVKTPKVDTKTPTKDPAKEPTEEPPVDPNVEVPPVPPVVPPANPPSAPTDTTFVNPTTAATGAVNDQIADLLAQISAMQGTIAANAAKPTVVGQKTVRKTGGVVEVYNLMSDGTQGEKVDSYTDFGARDSVMKMFENTGLGQAFITSLVDSIDKVYEENIMPTDSQVLNSIYSSDAYKTRFAANEAIRARMADGKGRPGDRLLTPYEYIQTEKAYEEILREADLPPGFYDSQDDFTKFIENSISTAELTDRVNIARNALQMADQQTVKALQDYYGLSTSDMTAYLLDKDRAFNLIDSRFKYSTEEAKKMYGAAEIGGAALRAGQLSDQAFSEEIYKSGKGAQAEQAFQAASGQSKDYKRLLGLYGADAGEQDLAREELALAGGTDVTMQKKKLASKERAKFSQRSAIDKTSLAKANKTANV